MQIIQFSKTQKLALFKIRKLLFIVEKLVFCRFLWLLWRKANCWKISKKKSTAPTLKRVLSFPRATKFFLIGKKNFFFCKKSNCVFARALSEVFQKKLLIFVIFLTKNWKFSGKIAAKFTVFGRRKFQKRNRLRRLWNAFWVSPEQLNFF